MPVFAMSPGYFIRVLRFRFVQVNFLEHIHIFVDLHFENFEIFHFFLFVFLNVLSLLVREGFFPFFSFFSLPFTQVIFEKFIFILFSFLIIFVHLYIV